MKNPMIGIFAILLLSLGASAIIQELQHDMSFTPESISKDFSLDLDFDAAFNVSITNFQGPTGTRAFCNVTPSEITSRVLYNNTLPLVGASFDNIVFFRGEYFALDTISWRILVTPDLADPSKYIYIEVDPTINHQHSTEIPFLVIDSAHQILYILRKDMGAFYELSPFYDKRRANETWAKITKTPGLYNSRAGDVYTVIKAARYYNKNIHLIVNDDTLEVWTTESSGQLTWNSAALSATFFGVEIVDIADIAFKDNYAFVLDELYGIYVVDISNYLTYVNLPASKKEIRDARLLEVANNSLNVISISRRQTVLHEYTIAGPALTLNREFQLRDAFRSSLSDGNFLYFVSGYLNVATKHSIPGTYNTANVNSSYTSSWPLENVGTVISTAAYLKSNVTVLQKNRVIIYEFSETKAALNCWAGNYAPGSYVYSLQSLQRTCKAREATSTDICSVRQQVTINVTPAIAQVSAPEEGSKAGMIVGIIGGIIILIILAYAFWHFKLRNREASPTVRNDVFFRRLSRSPLNADSSNLYKVTMDPDRSGCAPDNKKDEIIIDNMRKKSDDFHLGLGGHHKTEEDDDSPKKPPVVRGKTYSDLERQIRVDIPKTNTVANLEGKARSYEGGI